MMKILNYDYHTKIYCLEESPNCVGTPTNEARKMRE